MGDNICSPRSLLFASDDESSSSSARAGTAREQSGDMFDRDQRQTIAAVSRLAAYMGRAGKGVNHIFKDLDSSRDGKLSHHELEQALLDLDINITTGQARALVNFMDNDGDGEIDVNELDSTIRTYKRRKRAGQLGKWRGNLGDQQDAVFPDWLIGREDFQQVFSRFSPDAGAFGVPELVSAIRKHPDDRLHRDVQIITSWLGQQESLRSLGAKRLMEVTNVVELEELGPEEQLFAEGDDSEAFFIVLSGHVVVLVKNCPVALLGSGETFGELGLQNLEKRTATIKADGSGAMLAKMRRIDYRHILSRFLVEKMQLKINLLQDSFALAKKWSHSKIRAFAYCMAHHNHVRGEYIYRQGEPAHNLYIVFRGKVLAQRVLRYKFVNRWPVTTKKRNQRKSMKQVTINLKTLSVGDTAGEDCVLGFATRQHQVVARTQDVQVCVVSRSNAFLYLTSGELDQLHIQTQDLYRYGGDNNTSYFKAIKGWEDAARIKNQVIGPSYRSRLETSERQLRSSSTKAKGNEASRSRHHQPNQHQHQRQNHQRRADKHTVKAGSSNQSPRSQPTPSLPSAKLAEGDNKDSNWLPSSPLPPLMPISDSGSASRTVVSRETPTTSVVNKFPRIEA